LSGTATVCSVEMTEVMNVTLAIEVTNQEGIGVFVGSAVIRQTEENHEY
jgi:hypothetical protein